MLRSWKSNYKKINHKKYERAIQMVVCEGGDWQIQPFAIQPLSIQFFSYSLSYVYKKMKI